MAERVANGVHADAGTRGSHTDEGLEHTEREPGVTKALLLCYAGASQPSVALPLTGLVAAAEALQQTLLRLRSQPAVRTLTDPTPSEALGALADLAASVTSEDNALVCVSGYGVLDPSHGLVFGAPARAGGGPTSGLTLQRLREELHDVPDLVLLLDTSEAGAAAELDWPLSTALLCSVPASNQPYAERGGWLTAFLAEGLDAGDADVDGDGLVDLGELHRYLADRMASHGQTPLVQSRRDPAEVIIAPNPRGPRRRESRRQTADRLPDPAPLFVDRADELGSLLDLLSSDADGLAVAVTGASGMGKTQLALRAARQLRPRFPDGVLYTTARDGTATAMVALAEALGFRGEAAPPVVHDFLETASRRRSVLFVVDDVSRADPGWLRLCSKRGRSRVLLLGGEELAEDAVRAVTLGPLPPEHARDLAVRLAERAGRRPDEDYIQTLLERSPLYIALAVSTAPQASSPDAGESEEDAVRRSYEQLPEVVKAAFRRGLLADDELLDAEIVDVLVDGATEADAVGILVSSSLMAEQPDGRVDYASQNVRDVANQILHEVEDETAIAERRDKLHRWLLLNRQYPPEPRIARDFWTLDDELQYEAYADAIAAFIRHRSTLPPLTIGIKAPWGAGKTSLMRMVQERLDPSVGAGAERRTATISFTDVSRRRLRPRFPWWGRLPRADDVVTNGEVLRRARQMGGDDSPALLTAQPADTRLAVPDKDWRATVWFNPWKYQSGEQIWAGIAHEIIHQVADRLPAGDRERFWLRLNLARFDRDSVRRRAYQALWERLVPSLVAFTLTALIAVAGLVLSTTIHLPWLTWLGRVVGGASALAFLGSCWSVGRFYLGGVAGRLEGLVNPPEIAVGTRESLQKGFEGSFDEVFTDPGYSSKVGFLHLVQADMPRVLKLVASPEHPLVIFVDDLDRCSPGTVAQVIEAINLFLAGDFPDCIFVLALEPALVAAHIEVTYKDVVEALRQGRAPGDWQTLGWRFLEKIVQLPLSLPHPSSFDRYLASLLATPSHADDPSTALGGISTDLSHGSASAEDGDAGSDVVTGAGAARRVPSRRRPRGSNEQQRGAASDEDVILHRGSRLDPDLIDRLVQAIQRRRPGIATLPSVARSVQAELIPDAGEDPLRPETVQAVDRVFSELYSDADALAAIEAARPALSPNPREIKRYVNLFRFYTFIVQRQRLEGLAAPPGNCIAKLAAFAIRWPHLLTTFTQVLDGSTGHGSVAGCLEEAAVAGDDTAWRAALATAGLLDKDDHGDDVQPEWSAAVRSFLGDGPRIGDLAGRLL